MKSIRLLPVVIFATFALLVLKGVGLVTQGGYVLVGTQPVLAQAPAPRSELPGIGSGGQAAETQQLRNIEAAERASDALFSRAEPTPLETTQIDAVPVTETLYGDKVPLNDTTGIQDTEMAVLERLGERRTELDIQAQELEAREALVTAAERRLNDRISSLQAIEARIASLVDERKAMNSAQFNSIVGMYENMRPKDAAAIFDTLNMDVLLRVARSMNARKMAPVLAAMNTDRATELTALLADMDEEPSLDAPLDELGDLPQIVGN